MYLGDFAAGETVDFKWNTTAVGTGSITRATNGSIRIYKNESVTQRSSSAGITDSEDFDSLTGLHHLTIDLSDNTDAGFYAAGNDYAVVIQGMVVDGETFNAVIAHFSIENRRFLTAAAVNAEVDTALADYDGPTNAEMEARTLVAADYATATALATVDQNVDDILVDTGTTLDGKLDTIDGIVDAIKLSTDNLPSDPADQSLIIAATDALSTLIGDVPTNAELTTALADLPTNAELTTALADLPTNAELATALGTADDAVLAAVATVDTVVDAIKAKTDSLTFTQAGVVDSNITHVNEIEVGGSGTEAVPWGPA